MPRGDETAQIDGRFDGGPARAPNLKDPIGKRDPPNCRRKLTLLIFWLDLG
jgi:hypothetical protein